MNFENPENKIAKENKKNEKIKGIWLKRKKELEENLKNKECELTKEEIAELKDFLVKYKRFLNDPDNGERFTWGLEFDVLQSSFDIKKFTETDMTRLFEIDDKRSSGLELSIDELRFYYAVDRPHFGGDVSYDDEMIKPDLAKVFGVKKEQIAVKREEINENIAAYFNPNDDDSWPVLDKNVAEYATAYFLHSDLSSVSAEKKAQIEYWRGAIEDDSENFCYKNLKCGGLSLIMNKCDSVQSDKLTFLAQNLMLPKAKKVILPNFRGAANINLSVAKELVATNLEWFNELAANKLPNADLPNLRVAARSVFLGGAKKVNLKNLRFVGGHLDLSSAEEVDLSSLESVAWTIRISKNLDKNKSNLPSWFWSSKQVVIS